MQRVIYPYGDGDPIPFIPSSITKTSDLINDGEDDGDASDRFAKLSELGSGAGASIIRQGGVDATYFPISDRIIRQGGV